MEVGIEMDDITEAQKIKSQNIAELSMTTMVDSSCCQEAFQILLEEMLEKIIIEFCFEKHEAIKESVEYDENFYMEHFSRKVETEVYFVPCSKDQGSDSSFEQSSKRQVSKIECPCCGMSLKFENLTRHFLYKIGKKGTRRNTQKTKTSSDTNSSDIQSIPVKDTKPVYTNESFNSLPEEEKEAARKRFCLALTTKNLLCKKSVNCHIHKQVVF